MPSSLGGSMGALLGGSAGGGPNRRPSPPTASGPAAPTGPAPGQLGQGMDAVDQQLMAKMQSIRAIGDQVTQLAQTTPELADEMNQIQQILKAAVVKAASSAPMQSASSMAVPGNGGGA